MLNTRLLMSLLTLNQQRAISRLCNTTHTHTPSTVTCLHRRHHQSECTTWRRSSPHLRAAGGFRVDAPPPPPPPIPRLFLEPSPGETVQCLNRSILIHDTTFEQKHFYILLSRSKKTKRENVGFSMVSCSAFWLWCVPLPQGGDDDTFRWKRKCVLAVEVEVCSGDCPVDSKCIGKCLS